MDTLVHTRDQKYNLGGKVVYETREEVPEIVHYLEDSLDQLHSLKYVIDEVFDAEEVYDNFSREEITEFMESLNQKQFEDIMNHFQDMPGLRYEVEWTCPACGQPEKVMLEGITAFFT